MAALDNNEQAAIAALPVIVLAAGKVRGALLNIFEGTNPGDPTPTLQYQAELLEQLQDLQATLTSSSLATRQAMKKLVMSCVLTVEEKLADGEADYADARARFEDHIGEEGALIVKLIADVRAVIKEIVLAVNPPADAPPAYAPPADAPPADAPPADAPPADAPPADAPPADAPPADTPEV